MHNNKKTLHLLEIFEPKANTPKHNLKQLTSRKPIDKDLKPNPIDSCAEEIKACDESIAYSLPKPKRRKLCQTDLKPAQNLMTRSSKRRHKNSLAQLLDYVQSERDSRHSPVPNKAKHEKVTIYRHHSLEKMAWVIYLRFFSFIILYSFTIQKVI